MKKTLATIGATTAFAFAGLGLASVASAQVDSTDEAPTVESDTDDGAEREGRRGNRGEGRGHRGGCGPSEEVAELLGMDVDELRAELDAGSTLAEVAEANGVDPDELVDLMVANATERIDEKVAEGRLTEDEAADKLAEKSDRIEDKVFGADDAETDVDA